jgi:hypothetical protein
MRNFVLAGVTCLLFIGTSCVKDNVSDNGTIYGLWNAKDILSSYRSPTTYIVSIDRDIIDTSVINVTNLYGINGGGEYEGFVLCRRSGNTLTIFNCSLTGYHFAGTGTYDEAGRKITWNYTVSTPVVQNDQVYTEFTRN